MTILRQYGRFGRRLIRTCYFKSPRDGHRHFRDIVVLSRRQILTSMTDFGHGRTEPWGRARQLQAQNTRTDYVYSKIKDHQAIRDVRIELYKSSFFRSKFGHTGW